MWGQHYGWPGLEAGHGGQDQGYHARPRGQDQAYHARPTTSYPYYPPYQVMTSISVTECYNPHPQEQADPYYKSYTSLDGALSPLRPSGPALHQVSTLLLM